MKRYKFGIADEALGGPLVHADRFARSYHFCYFEPADAEEAPISPERSALLKTVLSTHLQMDIPGMTIQRRTVLERMKDHESPKPQPRAKAKTPAAKSKAAKVAMTRTPAAELSRPERLSVSTLDDDIKEQMATSAVDALLNPEIGMLFLDRTRIRPNGFAVGEHLYSLSLAPGEEVTLEQRTFSQRETTFEETQDQEQSREEEMSSTLTTEMQNSLTQTSSTSATESTSLSATAGINYGISVSVSAERSNSITEADEESREASSKNSNEESRKIAAKFRAQHKTVFKVSSVDRFESSSKRVIRNPNPYTALDLVYFKVMQRLRLSQERVGVRVAWTPYVKDPAFDFLAQEQAYHDKLVAELRSRHPYPPKPVPPSEPGMPPPITRGLDPAQYELTEWGFWNDMSADYDLKITIPDGYLWDQDINYLKQNLTTSYTGPFHAYGVHIVGAWPATEEDRRILVVKIHAGVDWGFNRMQLYVSLNARFVPDPAAHDAAYQARLAEYQAALATWTSAVQAVDAQISSEISTTFTAWKAEHRAHLDVRTEMIRRFITLLFPADRRDDIEELDTWQRVFDWDLVGLKLYAATWTGEELREPDKPPADFINASWARLYLPLRLGHEEAGLQWIFTRGQAQIPPETEAYINDLVTQVRDYRLEHLGGADELVHEETDGCPELEEQFVCLGVWDEVLPTDGTHIEVLHAVSTAADEIAESQVETARALQAESVKTAAAENALRTTANQRITKDGSPAVNITVDRQE